MSAPALRFRDEDGRAFPDWEMKKLGDLGKVSMCKRVLKEQTSVNGEVPFYKIGTFGKQADAFIAQELYEKFSDLYPFPKTGDILISAAGTIGRTVVYDGKPAYFQDSNIVWIDNDESFVINKFLNFCYETIEWTTENTTIARLYNDNLKSVQVKFPSLVEQTKIANFLTAVDEKLAQLTRKHDLLTQYKKGVMQQIFSQELRFKDDNGRDFPDWEEIKLSNLGASFSGLTGKSGDDFGDGQPYVTYKQIFDDSIIDVTKFARVQVGADERQNRVRYGDVFFTTSSETPDEVGYCAVLLNEVDDVYLNSFCFGYRIHSFDIFNPNFARFIFTSSAFRRGVINLAQGSTRYNISKIRFMEISIQLPCVTEQTKIANFLTAIDEKISATKTQLEAVKQYKQGLLQQMFV